MSKNAKMTLVHVTIALVFMLAFPRIGLTLPNVTPVGMEVLAIFLGTLYLWTTIDPLTSSLIAIIMLALSSYDTASNVLATEHCVRKSHGGADVFPDDLHGWFDQSWYYDLYCTLDHD